MLPRLEAEERLAGIQQAYAAEGRSLEDKSHAQYLSALQEQAAGRKVSKGTAAKLTDMGVTIRDG